MTKTIPSTHGVRLEDTSVFTHTTTSQHFSRLLSYLSAFLEAERDIQDVDVFDPAFSAWLRDAELAQETVSTRLTAVLKAPVQRNEDRALQRIAFALHALLGTEAPGEFMRIYQMILRFPAAFTCAGRGAVGRRTNEMLSTMRMRMADLSALATFNDDFDAEPDAEAMDSFSTSIAAA
jgi:hypothetical protein